MEIDLQELVGHKWCAKHFSTVERNAHRIDPAMATAMLGYHLFTNQRFMRMCGYDPEKENWASMDTVRGVIADLGPVCCFLGDSEMKWVYVSAMQR